MLRFVPKYHYRRRLLLCSAVYYPYIYPWLLAPWKPGGG